MDESKKIHIVERIILGVRFFYIEGKRYKLVVPSREDRMLGEELRLQIINEHKYSPTFISREQASHLLAKQGIWTQREENSLEGLQKNLEDLKISLYQSRLNSKKQKTLRIQIRSAEKSIENLAAVKLSLEQSTLEYYAELSKKQYILAVSILNDKGEPVYSGAHYTNLNSFVLDRITYLLTTNSISISEYKEIARTDPFRSYWGVGKDRIFGTAACDWTEEQRLVVSFAKMYDNIYQSMDCPPEDVIEDDDMLDGWCILQRRKREQESNKQDVDKIVGNKHNNANEVFVFAPTREDANKVYNINDGSARMTIAARKKQIEQHGAVMDQKLNDNQFKMKQQLNEMRKRK